MNQFTGFVRYVCNVEKILKGSLNLIPSSFPSSKIQIMGGKVCLRFKSKTLMGVVNKLLKIKSLLQCPAMFCLYTSSKLSRLYFEFSLKMKLKGLNTGYLFKSFRLYDTIEFSRNVHDFNCNLQRF